MKKFLKAVGILLAAVLLLLLLALLLLLFVPLRYEVRQLPPDSGQPGT